LLGKQDDIVRKLTYLAYGDPHGKRIVTHGFAILGVIIELKLVRKDGKWNCPSRGPGSMPAALSVYYCTSSAHGGYNHCGLLSGIPSWAASCSACLCPFVAPRELPCVHFILDSAAQPMPRPPLLAGRRTLQLTGLRFVFARYSRHRRRHEIAARHPGSNRLLPASAYATPSVAGAASQPPARDGHARPQPPPHPAPAARRHLHHATSPAVHPIEASLQAVAPSVGRSPEYRRAPQPG
jgi:hypothetical protein